MTQEPVESWEGNDGFHKPDFAERRIERFAKSVDDKWIFCLKNDDDDETNWYFLTEEVLHDLASQKQKIREEESDKMANAIEMSKQGWIEEGKQKQIEEIVSMLSGYIEHTNRCIRTYFEAGRPTKDGYEQKYRDKWYESSPVDKTPKCDCGLDDILTKLKESALNKK